MDSSCHASFFVILISCTNPNFVILYVQWPNAYALNEYDAREGIGMLVRKHR